ncbi:UDP-glucose/GDP-mannose dehydrogenase family, central domain-containing protein [Nemania sp. FL0031]|nr:UDP-glucose/GDP-mannose dehydrogenase family, central domain-containing protein [Nemania sp. FL0031]
MRACVLSRTSPRDDRGPGSRAKFIFLHRAVNTPTKSTGAGAGRAMDLSAFEAVACEIARYARAGTIIVEKSTVPCRTAQLIQDIMAVYRPDVRFEILSNPEFLAAGTAVHDLLYPDRILIGCSQTPSGHCAASALADLYAAWVPRARIITTNIWSSELSKLVANALLAQRISSINSISALCEATGAEIDEVAASIGSDARIGDKFLRAGIGFRGSCFKKDVLGLVYLADSLGLREVSEYWQQVVAMNKYQRDRFSQRVVRCLNNTLVGKKATLLGFAFKANTSDVRESPTRDIIQTLLDEKPREIAIFDPCCNPSVVKREIETMFQPRLDTGGEEKFPVVVYSDIYEACAGSNAVVITIECDEFRNTRPPVPSFPSGHRSNDHVGPRPFAQRNPSEMEILSFQKFLLQSSPGSACEGDPLRRYEEEPACAEDCSECEMVKANGGGARQMVDWHKISYHMKKPKWLFDGRGIIDPEEMSKLDIRVESIGRRGRG